MERALILSGGGARGAFQVGVWKYLREAGWEPDLICGTSIGAVNAVGIGAGLDMNELSNLWTESRNQKIYKIRPFRFLLHALTKRKFMPLMDNASMEKMLEREIDFTALKKSRREILISAVNMHNARPEFFDQTQITPKHVMASCAIPLIFPCQYINGTPYWDGGVMVNTPLLPVIDKDIDEIIVVLLSPMGTIIQPEPHTFSMALESVFEQFLTASYQTTKISHECFKNQNTCLENNISEEGCAIQTEKSNKSKTRSIVTIAPSKMLGFRSLLDFTRKQSRDLIKEGYKNAKKALNEHLSF